MRLALENPRLAVNATYHFVNRYLFEASQELDPEQIRYTDGSPAVRRAAVIHLLAPPHVDVLDRLRDAALSAVDPDEEIMPGQALDYVLHATQLIGYLAGRLQVRRAARAQEAAGES